MKNIAFFAIFALTVHLKSAGGQKNELKCSILNDRCSLPFDFEGEKYHACTTDGIGGERSWCPTEVYANDTADVHYCMECFGEQRCYYKADSFPDSSWILSCPPGCYYVQKRVYGTNNEFSSNSFICAAAIHQGLITNETGGTVSFQKSPARRAFTGAEKNEIKTYSRSTEGVTMMKFKEDFAASPTPEMIFTQDKVLSSLRSDRTVVNLHTGASSLGGVACDHQKKKVYWTDLVSNTIFRADYDGKALTSRTTVVFGSRSAKREFIALNCAKDELYWTDSARHRVSVSKANGLSVRTIIQRGSSFVPKGIALDLKNGYFYVADAGRSPKIQKCSMVDEGKCTTIVNRNILSPAGIAIDPERKTVCWADSKLPNIACSSLDGSNRRDMKYSATRLKEPFAIAILDGRVYWTDLSATIIASADLASWDSFHIHLGDVTNANGLTFFDEKEQKKCEASAPPQDILDVYVADTVRIRKCRVDLTKNSVMSVASVLTGQRRVTAVSVDIKRKEIYWTDTAEKKIFMAPISSNLNNGKKAVIQQKSGYISKPEGLAIDSVNRLLYWTDIDLHGVYVTNLDKKNNAHYVAVIVSGSDEYAPKGLALDPDEGFVYVVDSADPSRIQRCENKGGSLCKDIIKSADQPNWVTLDNAVRRIYVTDTNGNKVFSTNYLGINRKNVAPSNIKEPYGLGLYKNKVYVSDRTTKSVVSFDKTNGGNYYTIAESLSDPLGIFLYDPSSKNDGQNDCAVNTCSFICVPIGNNQNTCLCPEKLKGVNDAKECEIVPPCLNNPCLNGGTCVENQRRTEYTCTCPKAFSGTDCVNLQPKLTQTIHPVTKAVRLECIAPTDIKSEIIWLLNRVAIDRTDVSYSMSDNNRILTIQNPYYDIAGWYACQFGYGGVEKTASALVKVNTSIEHVCGKSPGFSAGGRVQGGVETKLGNAPFMAMLHKNTITGNPKRGVFCGGSLVTTRHVISAAHCFLKISFLEVTVYVGKLKTDLTQIERMQQSSDIKSILNHGDFHPKTLHADYTIITLKTELYFTAAVKPVCIEPPSQLSEGIKPRRGKRGIVYGWGLTNGGLEKSKRLQEIVLEITRQKTCKNAFKDGQVTNLMFCAGGKNKDTCKGDSGGPFTLWSQKSNKWYLGGVVSWGYACGMLNKPGVYARIGQSIRQWIYDNTDLK